METDHQEANQIEQQSTPSISVTEQTENAATASAAAAESNGAPHEPRTPKVSSSSSASSPAPPSSGRPQRERKAAEHFKPQIETQGALIIQQGAGDKLGDIPNIVTRLTFVTRNDPMLKSLHRVLFHAHAPSASTVKQNITEFSGLLDEQVEVATGKLETFENKLLCEILSVLDLEVGGVKAELISRIVEFLKKPHATGRGEPVKGGASKRKSSGGSSSAKKSKAGKKTKKDKVPRAPTSFMLFCKDRRPDAVKKHPSLSFTEMGAKLGEMWRESSEQTKNKYMRLAAEAKAAMSNGGAGAADTEDEESGDDDDDDDDEEEADDEADSKPLKPAKSEDETNAKLRVAIKKILATSDVTTLSVNKIREQLVNEHAFASELVNVERKAVVKEIITEELEKI